VERVRFDYTNVMADVVGPEHGISEGELQALEPRP
jgi:hypothetical protein